MGFCYRNVTKGKTNIKEDIIDYVKKFYVITRKVIDAKKLLLTKENIGNADETPIFMEMNAKKTLSLIGEKDISVKTFNKSHTRISVMLTILGNGKSLKPFVVFSGKPNGPKEKKLKSHPKVLSGYIYVCCQEKSWVDESTIRKYLNDIWFKEGIYKRTRNTLLVMDRARSHFSDAINKLFEKIVQIMYLFLGLTSALQPLDIHINKIFKANVRNEYHNWLINTKEATITDDNVIDFIYNAWYKTDQKHKEKIIEKPFRDNGITLKTDGSEDSEFLKIPNEFIDQMKNEYNELESYENNNIMEENVENDEENIPLYINNHCISNVSQNNNKDAPKFKENILYYLKKQSQSEAMDIEE